MHKVLPATSFLLEIFVSPWTCTHACHSQASARSSRLGERSECDRREVRRDPDNRLRPPTRCPTSSESVAVGTGSVRVRRGTWNRSKDLCTRHKSPFLVFSFVRTDGCSRRRRRTLFGALPVPTAPVQPHRPTSPPLKLKVEVVRTWGSKDTHFSYCTGDPVVRRHSEDTTRV